MTLKFYSKATLNIVLFYNLIRADPENLLRVSCKILNVSRVTDKIVR